MFVMRKLNRELLRRLRVAKGEAIVVARRGPQMANRANGRAWSAKELSPVTRDARLVVRKISDVRKVPDALPVLCGHLVTGDAGAAMFFGRVRKPGVINSRCGGSCGPPSLASLGLSRIEEV